MTSRIGVMAASCWCDDVMCGKGELILVVREMKNIVTFDVPE